MGGRPLSDFSWSSYVAFQPGVSQPWHELSPGDARKVFAKVIAAREERVASLRQLLEANGRQLGISNDDIQDLEDWFRGHVVADPDEPSRPDARSLALAFDIGVFLGELMIRRRPELRWKLLTSPKRDVSFQRPVVSGFSDPSMHIDPIWSASSFAFRLSNGSDDGKRVFLRMLWNAKATEDWSPRQSF